MRKTKDDAEQTRQKILDSAMSIFTKDGYFNARLEDIAAEAGVTRGAVYHHFGGKPEVYTALVNERFEEANASFNDLINGSMSPGETLKAIIIETLTLLEKNEEYRQIQELVLFKTAYLPELDEGMKYKIKNTNYTVDYIESLIAKGIEGGEFKKSLNPRAAAVSAVGLFSGVSTLWLLDNNMFSVKDYAQNIAEMFISGISAS